jgi:hypothetical protein
MRCDLIVGIAYMALLAVFLALLRRRLDECGEFSRSVVRACQLAI